MLHDVAGQDLAADIVVVQQVRQTLAAGGLHLRITVLLQNGEERAAGGVQNFLEIVRDDHAAHTVGLQIHNEHALVLGGKDPQKMLGIPLFGQGLLQLLVQAPQLALLAVAGIIGLLVLPHGSFGLIHGIVQPVQVVGALDAHRDLIFLLAQESTHLVHSHPHAVGRLVRGEDHEFVTADAVDAAGNKELAGRIGNEAEHGITAAVAQMVVDLVQAHHIDIGAHHGVVFAGLQRPQIGLEEAAVQQASQGVVAVGEVQLLAEMVGLCILTHHHGGPWVLGAAVAAGQKFHGDPHELAGHVFAEAVGLRLLGAENSGAQGLQIGLVGEHLRVVRVDHLVRHHALTVSGKVLLSVRTRTGQARIPLDDPVFAGGKVQQRKLQHIIRKDLVGLQRQCGLLTVGDGCPAVTAQQVAAHIPVILAVGLGQQGLGILHRHGLVEVIALRIQAVGGLQHGDLLRRFHAFGDDGQIQAVGHIHHRFHDLHALAAVLLVHVDELHVQLDGIHVGVLEHVQRRVAAAKVVHQHREALAVQALDGVFHHRGVLGQHGLGDLGQQELGLQLVFLHQIREDLRHVQIHDVHHGHVHRHRHQIAAAGLPLLQRLADGFPDVLVQPGDQAGVLQQGHELGRLHAAAGGVVPAHQCFHAHDGAGHAVALGLQKEAELVIFQGVLQLTQQLTLLLDPAEHGRRKAVHTAHGRAGVYRCDLCKCIGLRCADIFIQLQFFGHDKSLAVGCFRQNMAFYKTV